MDNKDRHTSILITCLVFIGVGTLFAVLVKSGFQQQRRAQEQRDYLARMVQQLDAQKQSLEKEREGLQNDPVFVEREVRRLLGRSREGEKPVARLQGTASAEKPAPQPAPAPEPRGRMVQQMRHLMDRTQMAVAVILVILVALAVGIGFGGRGKPSVAEPPKDEQKKP